MTNLLSDRKFADDIMYEYYNHIGRIIVEFLCFSQETMSILIF